ncbi:TonB-dependent siderophore receptor [Kordiimonas gwangyangensis]|uniref:TonB-dependent siderophore receptor n=1 Tax=Kordiimonas gwangyangensis TaxID=288022 RepID=UPI0003612229|nr:TonB-dependent siderophore receptor [Kordiimonas gwangyangensis]
MTIHSPQNFLRSASVAALIAAAFPITAQAQSSESYDASDDDVEEIVVTGRAQALYRVSETGVARGAGDPMDIPQAVTIINEALIADQGARDMTDLYRNIAGITTFSYSGVTFRGFRQDQVFYDGLRGNPFIAFSVPKLFNIKRVEVLKGPAGMLYGPGEPGGLINYVTKTPTDELEAQAAVTAGNYNRYGASGDVSGPLNKSGTILGRVGAFYETMDPFRNNTEDQSLILDAGLTFKMGETARLITQVTHYDQDMQGARLRGVPTDDEGNFLTDISWNANEATDFLDLKATVYQARFQAEPAEGVTTEFGVRYFDALERQQYHEPRGLIDTDDDGVMDSSLRELRDQQRKTDGFTVSGMATYAHTIGGMENKILVGGDWYRENANFWAHTVGRNDVPILALDNPVYGLSGADFYDLDALPLRETDSQSTKYGFYIQDQLSLTEQFTLVGGLRYDSYKDEDTIGGANYDDNEISFRAGLIYQPQEDISLYASWSESFEPQSISSQDPLAGGPFNPITGEQIEAGIKVALLDGRLQASAAAYQIKRQNLLQLDPNGDSTDGVDDMAPIGEVTAKGFDIELAADLTDYWVLTANYGYNDTKITGTVEGQSLSNAVGDRFANAPKHQAGLWTRYEFAPINTTFAFGAEYVSKRVSIDGQSVKAYTIFDTSVIHQLTDRVSVMLRVDNIFNKEYAASGFIARDGHFPGEPRTAFIELKWKL